ncbi:MAG: hypothetical protein RL591_1589 [Planctomycetota bacterium]|jgi:hypothetical protein
MTDFANIGRSTFASSLLVLLATFPLSLGSHASAQAQTPSLTPSGQAPRVPPTATPNTPKAPSTQPANAPASSPAGQSAAGPVARPGPIIADPQTADFGVIEPGTTVSTTIKIMNPLNRPITIKAAKPSCTCTTVDMTGKVIPAGGFLEMPMSMKTGNSTGKRMAKVNMVFEGLDQMLSVDLVAETAYMVRANPAYIDALAPERMKGFFELIARDDQPFTVLTIDGKPATSPDGNPMKPAARQVVSYDFTNLGTKPVPPYLIVETDHPKAPLLDLRVRHETTRITPGLPFAEFRENVGVLKPQGSVEFEVHLKAKTPSPITSVDSTDPAFRVELLGQTSDGEGMMIRLRFTDVSLPKGMFLRPCRFQTAGKSADLLLYGSIR